MKEFKKQLTIMYIERLHNSIYGNPKWMMILRDDAGNTLRAKTASDAAVGYEISWHSVDKNYIITYHYTKNNNIIVTRTIKIGE